jgi:hypothetical protein
MDECLALNIQDIRMVGQDIKITATLKWASAAYICWFIAGAISIGQSLAKTTLLSKSSALPEARLAIVLALAGAI